MLVDINIIYKLTQQISVPPVLPPWCQQTCQLIQVFIVLMDLPAQSITTRRTRNFHQTTDKTGTELSQIDRPDSSIQTRTELSVSVTDLARPDSNLAQTADREGGGLKGVYKRICDNSCNGVITTFHYQILNRNKNDSHVKTERERGERYFPVTILIECVE